MTRLLFRDEQRGDKIIVNEELIVCIYLIYTNECWIPNAVHIRTMREIPRSDIIFHKFLITSSIDGEIHSKSSYCVWFLTHVEEKLSINYIITERQRVINYYRLFIHCVITERIIFRFLGFPSLNITCTIGSRWSDTR